MFSISILLRNS